VQEEYGTGHAKTGRRRTTSEAKTMGVGDKMLEMIEMIEDLDLNDMKVSNIFHFSINHDSFESENSSFIGSKWKLFETFLSEFTSQANLKCHEREHLHLF
jgi:hypothetical protein